MRFTMTKEKSVVGLDIEDASVAATEIRINGSSRLGGTYVSPLAPGIVEDGEVIDPGRLGEALGSLFSNAKLPKEVRFGVANQRIAMRVLRLPLIEDPDELRSAIRFQAQDELPMPIDQAVLDFQVVRRYSDGETARMDVAVVAARRDMVSAFIEAARRASLKPVGIDLSAFALIRALAGSSQTAVAEPPAEDSIVPTTLYCNLGDLVNLVVARGSSCSFARVAPFGLEAIAHGLSERQQLTFEHARQWLVHVGLEQDVAQVEGDPEVVARTRDALEAGASKLVDELRLSLDFYSNQEGALPIEQLVFSGAGTAIAGLTERLGNGIGLPCTVARPRALAHLDDATAARLTVSYGLALED
jgi:type IV pilus assembly protein PilM